MIIGQKEVFAIELVIEGRLSNSLMWINSKPIGCFENPEFTDFFIAMVTDYFLDYEICQLDKIDSNLKKEEVFKLMMDDDKYSSSFFDLGEGYDDFDIHCYQENENVVFFWKLDVNKPYPEYQFYDLEKIYSGIVDLKFIKKVCLELREILPAAR